MTHEEVMLELLSITKSPRGAKAFLQNDKNNVELFTMFADILIENCQEVTSHIISTESESAINNNDSPLNTIQPCAQEEADTHASFCMSMNC